MIKHLTDGDIMNSPNAGKNKINEIIDVVNSLKYRIDCLHVDASGHLCSQEHEKTCETCGCFKSIKSGSSCFDKKNNWIYRAYCQKNDFKYWQPKEEV